MKLMETFEEQKEEGGGGNFQTLILFEKGR